MAEDRRESEGQVKSSKGPGLASRARNGFRHIWTVWVAAVLSAIVGLPAGAVTILLGNSLTDLTGFIGGRNSVFDYTLEIGLRVGLGALIGFGVTVGTPWVWRHADSPAVLRLIASTAVQGYALAISLFIPYFVYSFTVAVAVAGTGNVVLWLWQRRWRGVGVAPTPLAGILRPALHPGQVWYATIRGTRETKVRPVIVLGESIENPGRWIVAYGTTQPPRSEWMQNQYVHVPYGVIRGIPKETWVSAKDIRELKRPNFRTYLGIAPEAVYNDICTHAGRPPAPDARLIREGRAGRGHGPLETALRQTLGLERSDTPPVVDNANWETLKTLLFMPIDPPKRPAHKHDQEHHES
jgi:hypothetical protein